MLVVVAAASAPLERLELVAQAVAVTAAQMLTVAQEPQTEAVAAVVLARATAAHSAQAAQVVQVLSSYQSPR
jgi:hypothetical protein